jgi:hypothetical protein
LAQENEYARAVGMAKSWGVSVQGVLQFIRCADTQARVTNNSALEATMTA